MKQLKKSKRPVVLTVKGKAAAIVRMRRHISDYSTLPLKLCRGRHPPGSGRRKNTEDPDSYESFLKSLKPSMAYVVKISLRANATSPVCMQKSR